MLFIQPLRTVYLKNNKLEIKLLIKLLEALKFHPIDFNHNSVFIFIIFYTFFISYIYYFNNLYIYFCFYSFTIIRFRFCFDIINVI